MMLWELIRDAWPLILVAAVSLWYFCRAMIPAHDGDVMLSSGNEAAKCQRMAERAREYEMKYGTREGNHD